MKNNYKLIVDTNILIGSLEDNQNISNFTKKRLIHFFRTGQNFTMIVAGSKMRNELTHSHSGPGLSSLLARITSKDDSMNVEIVEKENDIEIDEKIYKFVNEGAWDGQKGDPNAAKPRLKGDPHIVFLCNYFKVDFLFSTDRQLMKICREKLHTYFPNSSCETNLVCSCFWMDKKFDIINYIKNIID
jgi:hypothetical protein